MTQLFDPNVPAPNSPISSQELRNQFVSLYTLNSGIAAPDPALQGTGWWSTATPCVLRVYNANTGNWDLCIGTFCVLNLKPEDALQDAYFSIEGPAAILQGLSLGTTHGPGAAKLRCEGAADFRFNVLQHVGTPTVIDEAANRGYVDQQKHLWFIAEDLQTTSQTFIVAAQRTAKIGGHVLYLTGRMSQNCALNYWLGGPDDKLILQDTFSVTFPYAESLYFETDSVTIPSTACTLGVGFRSKDGNVASIYSISAAVSKI